MSTRHVMAALALSALSLSTACPQQVKKPDPKLPAFELRPDARITRALAPLAAGFPVVAYLQPDALDAFAERHEWADAFIPELLLGMSRLESVDRSELMSVGLFAVDNRDVHAAAAVGAPVGVFESAYVVHHRLWLPSRDVDALAHELVTALADGFFAEPDSDYAVALGLPPNALFADDDAFLLTPQDGGLLVDVFAAQDSSSEPAIARAIANLLERPAASPHVGPARAHFLTRPGSFGALISTFELAVASRALEPAARMRFFPRESLAARFPEEGGHEAASMRLLGVFRQGGERALVATLSPTLEVTAVVERFAEHDHGDPAATLGSAGKNDLLRLRYVGPLGSREGAAWLGALPDDFGTEGFFFDDVLESPELTSAALSSPELLLAEVFEELAPGMRERDASATVRGVALTYSADDIETTGSTGFAVDARPESSADLVTWLGRVMSEDYGVAEDDSLRSISASTTHPGLVSAIYAVHPDQVFGAPTAQDPGLSIHVDVVKLLPALEEVGPLFVGWARELDVLHLSHDPGARADTFALVGGARGAFADAPTAAPLPLGQADGAAVAECFSEVPDLLEVDLGAGADIEAVRAFVKRESGATNARMQNLFACARERDPATAELVETAWLYRLAAYHDALREDEARDAILADACPRRRVPACELLDD